jgi:hypothetical protein
VILRATEDGRSEGLRSLSIPAALTAAHRGGALVSTESVCAPCDELRTD